MGNLRSKFGKNRSTNYVTFLSTSRKVGRSLVGRLVGWSVGRSSLFIKLMSYTCNPLRYVRNVAREE